MSKRSRIMFAFTVVALLFPSLFAPDGKGNTHRHDATHTRCVARPCTKAWTQIGSGPAAFPLLPAAGPGAKQWPTQAPTTLSTSPCSGLPFCLLLGERWALPVQMVIHPHHRDAALSIAEVFRRYSFYSTSTGTGGVYRYTVRCTCTSTEYRYIATQFLYEYRYTVQVYCTHGTSTDAARAVQL